MKLTTIFIFMVLGIGSMWAKSESKVPDTYAYTRGVEAYYEGNFQDALDWFNKELSDHPDNGYAYVYIASMRYGNLEYGKSLSAIDNALKRLPKKDKEWRSTAFASRARLYATMQDTIKSLADITEAIKISPSCPDYYDYRAQLYFEQKNYALADADYRAMIKLDQGDVNGYMGIGRNAIAEGRWDDAISQFSHVIILAPDYSSGYSFRADAYIAQEKWDEATDDIVMALDIDGDDKAFSLIQTIPADASELLRSKLKIQMAKQPVNWSWPYCLAVLAYSGNNYDEAISYYEKAHALDANSVFLENIATCYMVKEDYTRALDYADRALAMSPEDYDIINLKAEILSSLGRYDECLAERDRYIAKYPEYVLAYLSRADDLLSARRFERVIEDFNTAIVLEPILSEFPYILLRRGDAYRFTGKDAEARKDYEQLLAVEKDSVLTCDSWTPFAHTGLGNAEKAIETMQYILSNDTTDNKGNLYYKAACVYARLGQKVESVKYLSEAVSKGYKDVSQIESDFDLDCIRDMPEYKRLIGSVKTASQTPDNDADKATDESAVLETVEVPFTKEHGVTKVKCTINGLPLHFVFDTGAAEVTMSMVEANFMVKNDYIKPDDIIGSARYVDANGDITEGTVVNLRNVNFGGLELDNVRASVVRNQKAPLLLGQSVLGRLGKIEIDNSGQKLVITHIVKK